MMSRGAKATFENGKYIFEVHVVDILEKGETRKKDTVKSLEFKTSQSESEDSSSFWSEGA